MAVSIYPGIIFIIGASLLFGYAINFELEQKIEQELKLRRNQTDSKI